MKALYLDTSSRYLSLAVADGERILSWMHRLLDRRHSLQLVPLMDEILNRVGVPLKEIAGFCVGKGPGSFTGLRIGITVVKGLAFVLQKPVIAIPSLDILAQNAYPVLARMGRMRKIKSASKSSPLQVCTLVDAKQNKVYACLYQARKGSFVRKSRYLLLPLKELLPRLKGDILFLGDALALYRQKICQSKEIKPFFAEERYWYPRAAWAVPLALPRFQKEMFDDVDRLTPLYLYPQECQIRHNK